MNRQALFAPFEVHDASFARLKKLINSRHPPVALIGAGASLRSGYPTWTELLELLKQEAGSLAQKHWKLSTEDMLDAPWTAEVFAKGLRPGKLQTLIETSFRSKKALADPHLAIAKMPFRHFLTTNYDPSIEEALGRQKRKCNPIQWRQDVALSNFLIRLGDPELETHVVYLHGRYDSPIDDIILTERSYVARYIQSDDARRKLMAIFMTQPVVFIGFSMSDPDLANLMREVTARLRCDEACHFALMGYRTESDREATRERMEGKFGVTPVFFSRKPPAPGEDEFSNLCLLLDALVDGKTSIVEKRPKFVLPDRHQFDPEDPNRGRFGGASRDLRLHRQLSAVRIGGSKQEGILRLRLRLASTDSRAPLAGLVQFHLHPTFKQDKRAVSATDGFAEIEVRAYGAFTVGAVSDDGASRTELDLSTLAELPLWFRKR